MSAPSIKRNLFLGTGLATGVLIALGSVLIYLSIEGLLRTAIEDKLINHANLIAVEIEFEEGELIHDWKAAEELTTPHDGDFYFQVWDLTTGHTERSHSLGEDSLPRPPTPKKPQYSRLTLPNGEPAQCLTMTLIPHVDEDELEWAGEHAFVHHPETKPHLLFICYDTRALDRSLYRIRRTLVVGGLATLLLLGIVIHLVIRRSLRPLQSLSADLSSRSEGSIDQPIEIPPSLPVELRPQTIAFNTLLHRIFEARQRDRDFALHASHELRTPLAGVQATLENALAGDRTAPDYRNRIHQALDLVIPLRDSVSRVLYLARIQSGETQLHLEEASLPTLLHETWKPFADTAKRNARHVILPPEQADPKITTDLPLLRILLSNLLDNAIRHSPPESTVTISLLPHGLRFTNDAPGITQPELDRAFEPFVQLGTIDRDPTSGIGLPLCREIANILRLTLRAEITDDETASFTLEFPPSPESRDSAAS